jgi:hypothetical protein
MKERSGDGRVSEKGKRLARMRKKSHRAESKIISGKV